MQEEVKNGHLDIAINLLKTSRWLRLSFHGSDIQTKLFVNCISISIWYAYFRLEEKKRMCFD